MNELLMSPEQYENILASLQLEAINFEGDERFAPIAKLIERLAYEIPVCKRYVDKKSGYSNFLLVGYLNTKGDIILYEPKKVIPEDGSNLIHQIDYSNPIKYLPGFFTYPQDSKKIKNSTTFPLPVCQCNKIEEVIIGDLTIGFYRNEKITYWEQYIDH